MPFTTSSQCCIEFERMCAREAIRLLHSIMLEKRQICETGLALSTRRPSTSCIRSARSPTHDHFRDFGFHPRSMLRVGDVGRSGRKEKWIFTKWHVCGPRGSALSPCPKRETGAQLPSLDGARSLPLHPVRSISADRRTRAIAYGTCGHFTRNPIGGPLWTLCHPYPFVPSFCPIPMSHLVL